MAVTGVDIPSMLIQILTVSLSLIYLYEKCILTLW